MHVTACASESSFETLALLQIEAAYSSHSKNNRLRVPEAARCTLTLSGDPDPFHRLCWKDVSLGSFKQKSRGLTKVLTGKDHRDTVYDVDPPAVVDHLQLNAPRRTCCHAWRVNCNTDVSSRPRNDLPKVPLAFHTCNRVTKMLCTLLWFVRRRWDRFSGF